MRQPGRRRIVSIVASFLWACGSSGPDRTVVERFCGEGRLACIESCSGGGSYVPEPCRIACEAGRDACIGARDGHCQSFRAACARGCQTPRCTDACDAGATKCARGA
jgi:hypothetical protein